MVNRAKGIFEVNIEYIYIYIYISSFVSLASSSAAISTWICLEVLFYALNPSWISCSIWYLSSYADMIEVNVLV